MIWDRIDAVLEILGYIERGTWAHTFWSQVHAELFRKAVRQ